MILTIQITNRFSINELLTQGKLVLHDEGSTVNAWVSYLENVEHPTFPMLDCINDVKTRVDVC